MEGQRGLRAQHEPEGLLGEVIKERCTQPPEYRGSATNRNLAVGVRV